MQEFFDTFRDYLSDYYVCVSYFSLPVFDESCQIVRSQNLLLRDVLTCNPTNPHVALCGQYDPHYELSEYKMCWKTGRANVWKKIQEENYENIYLLFRTCLKNSITGENSHHISGLYEVDQELSAIHPDYNSPCIRAKSLHFTSIEDSVNIGYFYKKEPNPRFRFPFNSETNDGIYSDDLKAWASLILNSENHTQENFE